MTTPRTCLPLFALVLAACAATNPAPKQAATHAEQASGVAVVMTNPTAAVPIPDEPPAGLMVQSRIKDPRMSWANADRLLLANGGAPLGATPEIITMGLLGPTFADIVDLGAPVDLAVFGKASDTYAASFVVDPAIAPRLGRMFVLEPAFGMLRITGVRGEASDAAFEPMLPACAVTNPEEDRTTRLVCASNEDLLADAGGWLGRKVARDAGEGDVRVELDVARFSEATADDDNDDDEPIETQAEAAGDALAKSFMRDIGRLELVGAWGQNEVDAEVVLGFPRSGSPFSQVLTARPSPSTPAPELFARLPRDAAIALYGQGADARALAPLRDELLRALTADMIDEGYDEGLMRAFDDKVSALFFTGGPMAVAVGVDRAAAEKSLAALDAGVPSKDKPSSKADKTKDAARAAAYRSLRSWVLIGVDEPFERWARGISAIVEAGAALDVKKGGGAGKTPLPGKTKGKKDDRESTVIVAAKTSASAPKGSLHFEIRARPLVAGAPPAHTSHLYVVPDGARTWISVDDDEASLLARVELSRVGAPERTIAGLSELDLARAAGASAGGFFTLAGATQFFLSADRDSALPAAASAMQGLARLPSRGETIVPWVLVAEDDPRGGSRVRVKARLVIPALADLLALSRR